MTKKPFVTKEKLEEIAAAVPTPFHIYDEKGTVSYTHLTLPTILLV